MRFPVEGSKGNTMLTLLQSHHKLITQNSPYLSGRHLCCTTMTQSCQTTLNMSSAFKFRLGWAWFRGRVTGAEAWVEIALSRKHPPGDPIKATHQRGCLRRMLCRRRENYSCASLKQVTSCHNNKKTSCTKLNKNRVASVHLFVSLSSCQSSRGQLVVAPWGIKGRGNRSSLPTYQCCSIQSGPRFKFSQRPHIAVATFCWQKAQSADRKECAAAGCICWWPQGRMQSTLHSLEVQGLSRDGDRFESLLRRSIHVT